MQTIRTKTLGSAPLALALAAAVLVAFAPLASADDRVDALEREVQALREEVAALRASADPSRIPEVERRIEILAREIENLKLGEAAPQAGEGVHGLGPAASKVYAVRRGVSLGGYGEMLYEGFDATDESGSPSGRSDKVDFLRAIVYVGYKFNDAIVFNSEIEFEHASTGKTGEVSVEFAYLDFLLREGANVRAGMVLVPLGFVNELHEPPVFLGARRALVEQRLIPSTWRENGVGVFGEAGPLAYRGYLVTGLAAIGGTSSGATGFNAGGIRNGRSSGSNAAAEDLAVTGRLDWRVAPGLELGASFYRGNAGQGRRTPAGERIRAKTTLLDLHAELRWRGLETRALFVRTSIDDAAVVNAAQQLAGAQSVGERQVGYYGEIGYDVLSARDGSRQALIPYVRRERLDTQDRVPAGFAADPRNDQTVTTLGIAWKPIPNVAIKTDYNRIRNQGRTGVDQINLALGFLY